MRFNLQHRHLLFALVKRDVLGRYRGSVAGVAWSVIEPLSLLVIYTIVFGILLGLRLEDDPSLAAYALEVFSGIVVWLAVSEGLNRSTTVVVENISLVKKVIFPGEILPVKVVCSAVVHQCVGFLVLLAGMLLLGRGVSLSWLLLPVLILPQVLMTAGLAWLFAGIGVFIRDIRQAVALGTICWMFLTPIFYPEELLRTALDGKFAFWLTLNPAAALIHNYRLVLLWGRLPDPAMLVYLFSLGGLMFFFGFWWFNKIKKVIPDLL